MKTETYDNAADFLKALKGKKAAKDARPGIPRAESGEGDRIAQLGRIAQHGYSPRYDEGEGYCFWQPSTGRRTPTHAAYADACIAAERELS